jgi:hypothetical protein
LENGKLELHVSVSPIHTFLPNKHPTNLEPNHPESRSKTKIRTQIKPTLAMPGPQIIRIKRKREDAPLETLRSCPATVHFKN